MVGKKMNKKVVEVKDLVKTYQMGDIQVNALRGLSMSVKEGEVIAIMGPSGSGKSTLMNTLGCLDRPTSGTYILNGENVMAMGDDQLADVRNRQVGFIFQSYNLLSRSTAKANVMLPMRYRRNNGHVDPAEVAKELLIRVGLEDRMNHKPFEMSGGQQQRVAIARALVNNPAIILADEPTGNLDSKSGKEIMDLLLGLNKERGVTLIVVTHDPKIAALTQRTVRILDGRVENE
ncbi:ABC transport system ATP-binding protein [Pelolinea submarina]|uniref:Putative ABC transport system ATP-binding protein n=2 Tax=Pelolinea submarina TaxID=913107 RepID=A0A347ZPQ3_9CHLR|nr:putative ABC transport system ATP-binding protein [Pelolinea submarina]BBB47284.1 ABC transport system ATP-binding protein [Pelolinea submarina]